MEFRNLGRILFVTSIIIFLTNLFIVYPDKILIVSFIPLVFGVLSFIFLPQNIYAGPGLAVSFLVMILRYILSPFLLSISSYSLYFDNVDNDSLISFGLMILEMIFIILMIRKYSNQNVINNKPEIKNISYFIPLLFIFISVIWSLSDPIPISRYKFILSSTEELVKTDLSNSDIGLPRILMYTHYLLIISLFFYFYKLHVIRNKKIYFICGFIIIVLLTSFYQDRSRNSMLIPLLAVLFLGIKSFAKYKRIILLSLSIVIIFSMSLLSLLKFFKTSNIEKNLISKEISAQYINDYFGGYYEVFLAVEHSDAIKAKIDNKTLINDLFGNAPIINTFFDRNNRSSNFYNETAYSDSHIIPTVAQGYCYFGFLFSWIFTFIVFRFIFLFDSLYFKSNRIDYSFIFALTSVNLGWLHPGSFVLATAVITNFLILYFIIYISSYLGRRFSFRKIV